MSKTLCCPQLMLINFAVDDLLLNRDVVAAVVAQPTLMMLRMLSAGHLLLIDVDVDEGCILWAHLLIVVAAAQLSLSISTSVFGLLIVLLEL